MIAIDTNILVYSRDTTYPDKQDIARKLLLDLAAGDEVVVVLWQVACKFLRVLRRWEIKGRMDAATVESAIQATLSVYPLSIPSQATISRSLALYTRYSLSHWDCLLVAAAIEAGATTLYSEDLSHGITYDGLHVINPFRSDTP